MLQPSAQPHSRRLNIGYVLGSISFLVLMGTHEGQAIQPPSNLSQPIASATPHLRNQRLGNEPAIPGGGRVYAPPEDSRISEENHTAGGARGCSSDIIALAPKLDLIGQTMETRPTFSWYTFSDEVDALEFQLYRYQDDGLLEMIVSQPIEQAQGGYMAYTLTADDPALTVGETYVWQVILYCGQNQDTVGRWTSAEIEVVEVPVELITAIIPADPLEQARVYARLGLWYDAMAAVYDAETPEARAFRQDLLLDLADLEAQSNKAVAASLSAQLRQIAELEAELEGELE